MAIVLTVLHIFIETRKLGNIIGIFSSFSWGILSHVTRLNQSRASENISWIIIYDSRISKWIIYTHFHDRQTTTHLM